MNYISENHGDAACLRSESCSILLPLRTEVKEEEDESKSALPVAFGDRCGSWQVQEGARGGAPVQAPLGVVPKPAIAPAKPVRSCESMATLAVPNATIESAAVDPANPDICRVTA